MKNLNEIGLFEGGKWIILVIRFENEYAYLSRRFLVLLFGLFEPVALQAMS